MPNFCPLGNPSQCPISGRLTSCYLTMGDSHFPWIRTYSTSSTLVVALGLASSLRSNTPDAWGKKTEIWRTGSCIIAQAFLYSLCYLPVSALSVVQASLPGTTGIRHRRRRWSSRTYKPDRSQPPALRSFGQQTSLPTPRSITEPPLPTELVRRWIQGWLRATR